MSFYFPLLVLKRNLFNNVFSPVGFKRNVFNNSCYFPLLVFKGICLALEYFLFSLVGFKRNMVKNVFPVGVERNLFKNMFSPVGFKRNLFEHMSIFPCWF